MQFKMGDEVVALANQVNVPAGTKGIIAYIGDNAGYTYIDVAFYKGTLRNRLFLPNELVLSKEQLLKRFHKSL